MRCADYTIFIKKNEKNGETVNNFVTTPIAIK